jgi:iron(III) transport system permease protein
MAFSGKTAFLYFLQAALFAFFGIFFFYPLFLTISAGLQYEGCFSFYWMGRLFSNSVLVGLLINSFWLACATTLVVLLFTIPMSIISARFTFPGQSIISALVLMPLILPPFVGALSIKRFLGQFGILNLILEKIGIVDLSQQLPPDWLGSGFWVVVILQSLYLFPILYLNATAGLSNIDPSLIHAARNLGASPLKTFFRITLPLLRPHLFAGGSIVFIWSFTDIGTPLVVGYEELASIRIFKELSTAEASGRTYSLVLVMLFLSVLFYTLGKVFFGKPIASDSVKASIAYIRKPLGPLGTMSAWLFFGCIIALAILPHLGVVVSAFSGQWIKTILPEEFTFSHFLFSLSRPQTRNSIFNSFMYAGLSTSIDLVLGGIAAWVIVRGRIAGSKLLDVILMLPLAVPGIILAAGYVAMTVQGSLFEGIGPMRNPLLIIVIAYSVRRIPFVVRGLCAGLQQIPESLEHAAYNLGSSFLTTLRKITLPLVLANLIAAALLTFSFAMLEVSDSLVLAQLRDHYPITKEIYTQARTANIDANYIAASLGVIGMIILGGSLGGAALMMGKKLGSIFRA